MHPSLPSDSDLPPPTFNTLDSQQKTRLIRTTRKLGAVLGTTPHLAEGRSPAFSPSRPPLNPEKSKSLPRPKCSPKSDRSRRQGSVFEAAPSSNSYSFDYASSSADTSSASLSLPRTSTDSSNSDASTQSLPTPRSFARHVRDKSMSNSSKRAPLPTPLVLRLNAVALPPSDARLTPPDSATTLKGPGSAPRSGTRTPMPVTPTTPGTPATPTATETRRRRLAKLKRTLGENVPAELVIPAPRAAPSRRASPLDGPAAAHALAAFPLLSAPQRQAEQQYHAMAMTMRARPPPPRTQKSYPLPYAAPGSSSTGARVAPRKRSVSVDFKGGLGFMAPPHVASVTSPPPKPHTQPQPRPQPQAQAQAQTQAQGIRRAPSLSSRRRPAWAAASPPPPPRPEPVGSVDSGSGSGSESGSESGHGRGWVTGGTSWKGEWNRKDIHEVQRQLRNLKLR